MNNEKDLLNKIDNILIDVSHYEKAKISFNGDIVIKNKNSFIKKNKDSILSNLFKEIIANDIKKNRV